MSERKYYFKYGDERVLVNKHVSTPNGEYDTPLPSIQKLNEVAIHLSRHTPRNGKSDRHWKITKSKTIIIPEDEIGGLFIKNWREFMAFCSFNDVPVDASGYLLTENETRDVLKACEYHEETEDGFDVEKFYRLLSQFPKASLDELKLGNLDAGKRAIFKKEWDCFYASKIAGKVYLMRLIPGTFDFLQKLEANSSK